MLAAGLRLGVLPPHQQNLREPLIRRGLGTLIRFVPAASSVVLLVRAAQVEIMDIWVSIFMVLAAFSAILSAFAWFRAEDELQGRPFWILGMSAFAFASAALGLSVASEAWGLAMIFPGSLLFLFSIRHRWLLILLAIAGFGFSALPLSPSWEGIALLFELSWGYRLVFFVALALMLVGYLRFALQPGSVNGDFERWMWVFYPFGLALLPLTYFGLTYVMWLRGFREISFQIPGWWSGILSSGLATIIIVMGHRRYISIPPFVDRIKGVFDWAYRFIWWAYRGFGRALYLVTRLLEGEGSILWALLILIVLIVTIYFWGSRGGFGF